MEIKIDYYLKSETQAIQIMHTTVTETDIMEMLEERFRDGQLACPIRFDRETVKVDFQIDSVTA